MRKLFLLLTLTLCCSVCFAQSQNVQRQGRGTHRPNFEKYLEDRVSFVTKVMQLSPADSVKFVPVYKEMLKEKGDLMFKFHHVRIRPNQQYADSTYTNVALAEAQYKIEDAKCDMKYIEKFQKILTPKQVYSYTVAEKMFVGSFMGRNQANSNRGQRPQGQHQFGPKAQGTAPSQQGN